MTSRRGRKRAPNRATSANPPATTSVVPESPGESFPSPTLTTSEIEDDISPPALTSPIKRRFRNESSSLNKLSDEEVWSRSDSDIIAAARGLWRSSVYDHFEVTLRRDTSPLSLIFVFTCKYGSKNHKPIFRPRSRTSEGTSNLNRTAKACDIEMGRQYNQPSATAGIADPDLLAMSTYSPAAHRALILLRCARYARPFNIYADEEYKREVLMLRPDAIIPSPSTLSHDLKVVYLELSKHVKIFFEVILNLSLIT
ncbi:hypothetical protein CVT24_010096 [Panaeolus cyanescens]|uniref:Uncharacterized protein n=1 Tax=Panaeolus cyanescens TaxID=181874 RepID=A0A409X980_9AGAR|nr:hypothetical protein CVT24_010096 [Panaeolus cyanescens]